MQTLIDRESRIQSFPAGFDDDDDNSARLDSVLAGNETIEISHVGGELEEVWVDFKEDIFNQKRYISSVSYLRGY